MPGADGDDGLCPGLVRPRYLVEEDEGELVLLVGDLDTVAVYGVQILGDMDRDLPRGQEVRLLLPRRIEVFLEVRRRSSFSLGRLKSSFGFIEKNFTPPAIRLMFGAVMTGLSTGLRIRTSPGGG